MKPLYRPPPPPSTLLIWGLLLALCGAFLCFLAYGIGYWLIPYCVALTDKELFALLVTIVSVILIFILYKRIKAKDKQIYEE